MALRRYTVCSYLPDLKRPDQAYDFAVIAVGPEDVAAVGMDLAAFGVKEENQLAQVVIQKTFDVIVRRVQESIETLKEGEPALIVLDRVAAGSMSNMVFRPFVEVDSDESTVTIAEKAFSKTLGDWPPSLQEESGTARGSESPGGRLTPTRGVPAVGRGQPAEPTRGRNQLTRRRRQRRYQVFLEESFA